ncbi:hypothetical protein P171DRAFT_471585 [Karstenula rhodostoma CBS 690.94]|uniref:Phosphodiester glycosidase domain-containing protein n=1 Tax=Karstenula rhodostoma CBS 690.94 TaxID=1392251 RepID=A0A9P4PPY6_9PLEO|nr:hypothetical protein P171DRAFT_471585 [Karstenula rhodostoma CBS 690.94]
MRISLLLTVGAALSLRAHAALGNVICDTKHHSSIDLLEEATELCFKHVCADHGHRNQTLEHCGPIVLTHTPLGTVLPAPESCITGFRIIVDKCFTTEGVQGGASETPEALYSIFTTSDSNGQEEESDEDDGTNSRDIATHFETGPGSAASNEIWSYEDSDLEERAFQDGDDENEGVRDIYDVPDDDHSNMQVQRRARGGRFRTGKARGRSRSKTKPKITHRTRPKATHKTKPKTTKPKTTKPKSCPAAKPAGKTGAPGKGKKTVRDVVESISPQLLYGKLFHRARSPTSPVSPGSSSPRRKGDKQADAECEPSVRLWYRAEHLHRDVFMHWTFERKTGWSNGLKRLEEHRNRKIAARDILERMTDGGILDVIRVKKAQITVKGKQNGGSLPNEYLHDEGNYVLCNGGFFVRRKKEGEHYDRWSIGKTSSTTNHYDIPIDYQGYYDYLNKDVDPNNYLASGPRLDRHHPLEFSLDIFKFFEDPATKKDPSTYALKAGSLAHASEPNERLVIAELQNGDKYIFAYTATTRNHGVDLNKMREIVEEFLEVFHGVKKAKKILNLDGGGSLYLAWKPANKHFREIAKGKSADESTQAGSGTEDPRKVTNFVKLTALG